MAKHRMDVTTFVGKLLEQEDVDALREGVKVLAQALMEAEVSSHIGADPYERTTDRLAYRNGYRRGPSAAERLAEALLASSRQILDWRTGPPP